jgi:hypothetical protein
VGTVLLPDLESPADDLVIAHREAESKVKEITTEIERLRKLDDQDRLEIEKERLQAQQTAEEKAVVGASRTEGGLLSFLRRPKAPFDFEQAKRILESRGQRILALRDELQDAQLVARAAGAAMWRDSAIKTHFKLNVKLAALIPEFRAMQHARDQAAALDPDFSGAWPLWFCGGLSGLLLEVSNSPHYHGRNPEEVDAARACFREHGLDPADLPDA